MIMQAQAPRAVVMIRPHHFRSNPETQADNAFQRASVGNVAEAARAEFDHVFIALRGVGITVHAFANIALGWANKTASLRLISNYSFEIFEKLGLFPISPD